MRGWVLMALVLFSIACSKRESGPGRPSDDPLLVFAAASLRDALEEVGRAFSETEGGRVEFNFGPSNALARQIIAAPRANAFFSANPRWMDEVEKANRLQPGSRRDLLSNQLVVVGNAHASHEIRDPESLARASFRHLAIADPKGVPAGEYAKEYLEAQSLGHDNVWASVRERVVTAVDVRAALAVVEKKRDAVGIVYATDAATSPEVRVLFRVAPDDGPEIRYPVAIVRGSGAAGAKRFVDFVAGPDGRAVFERHGFGFTR